MSHPHPDILLDERATYGRSRAVRWAECDYSGTEVVHLTICADHGEPFRDTRLAKLVCDSVEFYAAKLCYRLYGFCLMPDHLHVLLSPGVSRVPVSKWLYTFKNHTGRMYTDGGGQPPLWQRSAHDHVCRDGETAETVLAYIVNNRLRRGLSQTWREWPWTRVFIEI